MKAIRFNSTVARVAAVAAVVISFVLSGLVVIWAFASTSTSSADQKEVAVLLTELSPGDPETHRTSAILHEKAFEPGDLDIALAEYEKAAAASPNNFLYWQLLGTARTRAGDFEKAEAALRRAKQLAPNYSRVQWALGNLLLRQGRDDEGYAEIRRAVEGDPAMTAAAVTTAMQLNDGDLTVVRPRFEGLPEAAAHLAIALLQQKRFDEAREIWRVSLVKPDTERLKEAVKALRLTALSAKQFRLAVEISAATNDGVPPTIGQVTNPGFELPVRAQNAGEFEWRVPLANYPQHAITGAQKRTGNYSLLAAVSGSDAKDFQGIAQNVAVEPGQSYELSIAYRSDVTSRSEYFWEVRSAVDSSVIAVTPALIKTDLWATSMVRFSVPKDVDGVEIRLTRGPCAGSVCAATGNLWFDDIALVIN